MEHVERPAPSGRRPRAWVIRDLAPEHLGGATDWTRWYLTDEADMGQSPEQGSIIAAFKGSLEELARQQRWTDVLIGEDNFFAWVPEHPLVRVSPDIYVLDGPPPAPLPASFQTWLAGHRAPRFALEVVSDDWRKDYEDNPEKYAQLGVAELAIFDPEAAAGRASAGRVALQLYRRDADGAFVRVHSGADAAWADTLGAYLVVARLGPVARIRLAHDRRGHDLVPTPAERADAEQQRADAEQQRADAEQQRADAEQRRADEERQRADALEHELAALRTERRR